jgi:simple sugar transport system ATP-binding protein
LDIKTMKQIAKQQLLAMGIDLRDTNQAIGTLSGGERQAVAIARAEYFGAKVLILDEPTSALGVRQSGIVLKYLLKAKERGVAVIFITHNPSHAYLVGDRFYLLNRGQLLNRFERNGVQVEELTKAMAGGRDLETLTQEIEAVRTRD